MPTQPDLRDWYPNKRQSDTDSERNAFTDFAGPIIDVYGYYSGYGDIAAIGYTEPHGTPCVNVHWDTFRDAHGATEPRHADGVPDAHPGPD